MLHPYAPFVDFILKKINKGKKVVTIQLTHAKFINAASDRYTVKLKIVDYKSTDYLVAEQ